MNPAGVTSLPVAIEGVAVTVKVSDSALTVQVADAKQ